MFLGGVTLHITRALVLISSYTRLKCSRKLRAQKNREVRLAEASCLIYYLIEYATIESDVVFVHERYLDSDY